MFSFPFSSLHNIYQDVMCTVIRQRGAEWAQPGDIVTSDTGPRSMTSPRSGSSLRCQGQRQGKHNNGTSCLDIHCIVCKCVYIPGDDPEGPIAQYWAESVLKVDNEMLQKSSRCRTQDTGPLICWQWGLITGLLTHWKTFIILISVVIPA